jgi:hypothetical protein
MLFHEVTIRRLHNGAVVQVGCKEFVFEKKNFPEMLIWVDKYLLNPDDTLKLAQEKLEVGKIDSGGPMVEPCIPPPPPAPCPDPQGELPRVVTGQGALPREVAR